VVVSEYSRRQLGSGLNDASEAFDVFVTPHLPILRAIAAREVGVSDADDVVQEALLRAWRRWETFDPERGTAKSWLSAVVLDQVRQRHRRGLRRHLRPSVGEVRSLVVEGPSGTRVDVERAIVHLPRRQRQVIVLHYLAELTIDEVAAVLRISAGSVKRHLFDARSKLRTEMKGDLRD
jgi:RNA polymerase sigma-70 factor (ECF subfamily)